MFEKETMKTAFRNDEVNEKVAQEIVKEYTEEPDAYQTAMPIKSLSKDSVPSDKVKQKTLKLDKASILSGIVFSEILGRPKGW